MIRILRDGKTLTVQMETGFGWFVNFTRESATELDAILLRNHLTERFGNRIQTINPRLMNVGGQIRLNVGLKAAGNLLTLTTSTYD